VLTWIIFLFVGTLSGVIIAYALDMHSRKELLQGAIGGLIAGLLMSAMLPH
jgi:predicted MFS family arabinose efflux permease